MLRNAGLIIVLLVACVAIALYMRSPRPVAGASPVTFQPQPDASPGERIAGLEQALAAQIDRSRTLEARIAALEEQLQRGRASDEPAPAQPDPARLAQLREQSGAGQQRPDPAALRERQRERQLTRLVEAGFTRERAEWIDRRVEELEYQAMQAQFEAQRGGRPGAAAADVQRALRGELGDAEYERYLRGTGRPTEVQVMDVLASSAAERAGLQPGDQVLSYAGTRVFDMRELNAMSREGNPGEAVTMEVRRNGQTVQVVVPRGVLGLAGGPMRGGRGGRP